MQVRALIYEDFINYRLPSIFIGVCHCDWKCCKEANIPITICQNHEITNDTIVNMSNDVIFYKYINNPITKAIVIGGLEPMLQFEEVYDLIKCFRDNGCNDDIIVYTGYYPDEIQQQLDKIKSFKNIIVKFGRYIPNRPSKYDDVLGITLVSDNQYAERVS